MRAGRIRHRVQFQQRAETRNEIGEVVTTWIPLRTTWAAVEPIRVKELIKSGEVMGLITHTVTTRYHPDVTTADRICFGPDRYLMIQGPPKDLGNDHFELEFACAEGLYTGAPS